MTLRAYLILAISLSLISGCREEKKNTPEPIRPVKVLHISEPQSVLQRSFPGKVEASQKADLAFLVSGKIIEFSVKEGEKVEQGQLIAKLDPIDYEIAFAEAKSKADYTQVELERATILLQQKVIPQSKYDAQKTAYDSAIANLNTARQNLAYTKLSAPFAGEIAIRYVDNFQNVKANEPIVGLHNRDMIDINIQLPENLAIQAKQGTNAIIEAEFDSAPGTRYPAIFKEISSKADPNTQTYKLTLNMLAPKGLNILPGMTTTIYIKLKLATSDVQYLIPAASVFADESNQSYVWVINSSTQLITKQKVKLGPIDKENIIITEGLSPGMEIVAAGAKLLREGMKVRPFDRVKE